MEKFEANDYSFFKEVAKKASIKDVIAHELGANAVVKKGKDFVCLCPFHNDHEPSMQINVARNNFKCWVDGHHGDPIDFVEQYEQISKFEALKKVCQICGIPLPADMANKSEFVSRLDANYKEELNALLELKKFYQLALQSNEGQFAREYLEKRKIPSEAISHFGIGFAPEDPSLAIKALRKNGFEIPTLEKAGILSNSSDLKDRFSYRLMYPIEDDFGHLVGFSGRKLRDDQTGGKYINYPSTQLFNKSEILYHYSQAKSVAKKYGYIYVVEGFNDAIAFQRAGIESCVASMGTALTEQNARSLKRLGVEVRLCLDRDDAGQKAIEDCLPVLLKEGVPFRVVRPFKGGKDADEVLANFYPEGNEELNKEANFMYDAFLFLLARALKANGNTKKLTDPLKIQSFIKKASPYYQILDDISKEKDLLALVKVTDMPGDILRNQLNNQKVELPKQEEKTPEKTIAKKTSNRTGYTWTKKGFNKEHEVKNLVNDQGRPKFHYLANNITAFVQGALYSVAGSMMNRDLVINESQIIYVLPHSREAYKRFQEAKFDISFHPFYVLSLLIDQIYRSDSTKIAFADSDYDKILSFVKEYTSKHEEVIHNEDNKELAFDEDMPFDADDISQESLSDLPFDDDIEMADKDVDTEFYAIEINPDDIDFLLSAVEIMRGCSDHVYSQTSFDRELDLHPLLLSYSRREGYCKRNNLSIKNDMEILQIKKQLKMKNFKIS